MPRNHHLVAVCGWHSLCAADRVALDIYARVERWGLDEVALPGKLVREIVERLYRENRFCRGTLNVEGRAIGPEKLSAPTLAIVNTADSVFGQPDRRAAWP